MNTLFNDAYALRSALDAGRIPAKSASFARSLLSQYASKGTLTPKQVYWAKKLVADNPAQVMPASPLHSQPDAAWQAAQAPSVGALNVQGIRDLFAKATGKLKKPAIVLNAGQTLVRLYVAGQASKFPGSVVIVAKHSKRYIGRIALTGDYLPSPAYPVQADVIETLKALSADPAAVATAHGKATGACCFCNTGLTDPKSLGVGYGPICAAHYGLPWGEKKGFLCS